MAVVAVGDEVLLGAAKDGEVVDDFQQVSQVKDDFFALMSSPTSLVSNRTAAADRGACATLCFSYQGTRLGDENNTSIHGVAKVPWTDRREQSERQSDSKSVHIF